MNLASIPVKFQVPWAASAGGGYIRTVPVAPGGTPGAASFELGFPPITFTAVGAGGIPPFGQDANGVLNVITAWLQWQQAGGPIRYDSAFSAAIGGYPAGAVLAAINAPGVYWISTVDNNTTNPEAGGAGWISSLTSTDYYPDTGSVNAIAIALPSGATPAAIVPGLSFRIRLANDNSGPTTIAVGTLPAVALKTQAGTDPPAKSLIAGNVIEVVAVSSSVFQWIAAQPITSYISSVPYNATPPATAKFPFWNPSSGANENLSLTDFQTAVSASQAELAFTFGSQPR